MRHLLEKHILVVKALDTYYAGVLEEHWSNAPLATAKGHHLRYQLPESIKRRLQCLDRPTESVLEMVKIGRK